jgi:hypothetical protein
MKDKLFLLIVLVCFASCNKKGNGYNGSTIHFGMSEYYAPFLGVKSDTITIEKRLKYEFNQFAKDEKSLVNISFVDKEQQLIDDKNIQFFVDEVLVSNNSFKISFDDASNGEKKIGIRFLPGYEQDYTSGFLVISNHSLDVINNNDLANSSEDRIFKWEAEYDVSMNPLKKGLIWFLIIIAISLLFWFLLIRNSMYPKFKKGKIQVLSPYFKGITINNRVRLIVFTNSNRKQKSLNSIFTGKIIYEVNPIYEKEVFLRPGRGNKIKIKLPLGARINPMVMNMEKFNSYTIQIEKEKIEIQYS